MFSNQVSHLFRDFVAVGTSRPFDFMIPSMAVSSHSYLAWHVAQNVQVCVSVCLTTLRPQLAVSAVSVWLGSSLCFTASNLYSVLLFLCLSVLHSLLRSSLLPAFFPFFSWILVYPLIHAFLPLHLLLAQSLFFWILFLSVLPTTQTPLPSPSLAKVCVKPFDSLCSRGCCAGLNVSSPD